MPNTYQVQLDFQDTNGLIDYTLYVSGTGFTRKMSIGKDGSPEVSTLDLSFRNDITFFQKFILQTLPILVKVKKNTLDYFTGIIRPNTSFSVYEKLREFSVQVIDNSYLLEKKISADDVLLNHALCDNAQPANSIVHKLVSLSGISNFTTNVYNGTIFPVFALKKDTLIKDVLDTLLYEYGLNYLFNESGNLTLKNIAPSTVFPLIAFNNSNMLQPLDISKNEEAKKGVKVKWGEIHLQTNTLLYRDITNPDSPKTISRELYYPANSNSKDVFQSYRIIENSEATLFHSLNHSLTTTKDNGIEIDKQLFFSDKAQISFHNTSTTEDLKVYEFDIRGDAYIQTEVEETAIDGEDLEEYSTEYIYSIQSAENLTKILKERQQYGSFTFTVRSKESYPVGTYATLADSATGLSLTVFIYSKQETDNEPIITYETQSFSGISFITQPIQTTTSTQAPVAQSGVAGADGEDAYRVELVSSLGDVFRITNAFSTTLEARVIQGGEDISGFFLDEDFRWVRESGDAYADAVWNSAHYSVGGRYLILTQEDVVGRSVFNCLLLHKRR